MVFQLTQKLVFPNPYYGEPDGLLAVGGDLSVDPVSYTHLPPKPIEAWCANCAPALEVMISITGRQSAFRPLLSVSMA